MAVKVVCLLPQPQRHQIASASVQAALPQLPTTAAPPLLPTAVPPQLPTAAPLHLRTAAPPQLPTAAQQTRMWQALQRQQKIHRELQRNLQVDQPTWYEKTVRCSVKPERNVALRHQHCCAATPSYRPLYCRCPRRAEHIQLASAGPSRVLSHTFSLKLAR